MSTALCCGASKSLSLGNGFHHVCDRIESRDLSAAAVSEDRISGVLAADNIAVGVTGVAFPPPREGFERAGSAVPNLGKQLNPFQKTGVGM